MRHRKTIFVAIFAIVALSLSLSACGGSTEAAKQSTVPNNTTEMSGTNDDTAVGQKLFATTCVACHGANAEGVSGLGPNLHKNVFISGLDADALAKFINEGRAIDAPENKTGVAMPPNGGNPNLSANDVADIAVYLRSLQ